MINNENSITDKNKIIKLLNSDDIELYKTAESLCLKHKGNKIHLRALIEFTNICRCNCFYCGLRAENKFVERYRMDENEIIHSVKNAVEAGYKTVVLQGGEDMFWNADRLCRLIEHIKKFDIALTLSIGERSYEEYRQFRNAGADRYLLRIETTDESLYKILHPNMSVQNRFECLYNLKSLGYETGTGCLVGLPNQTVESLAEDILFFKNLNADMVGIGPFIPHPNTPLALERNDNFDLALRVMAVTRLVLPDINIPATTAMESLKKNGRITAVKSGANVIMLNLTSDNLKNKYEIYPNKICSDINSVREEITAIGRVFSSSKGFRND